MGYIAEMCSMIAGDIDAMVDCKGTMDGPCENGVAMTGGALPPMVTSSQIGREDPVFLK